MKRLLFIFLFLLNLSVSGFAQERHGPYKIYKFVDGDTIWLKINGSKPKKNLWIDVDRPELKLEGLMKERPARKLQLI